MSFCCSASTSKSNSSLQEGELSNEDEMNNYDILTTCKHYVPSVYHEPHVVSGFRPLNKPWFYYLKSIFYLHNETINIWSHLLAFAFFGVKFINLSIEYDFVKDSYTWPLLAGLICGMALYACSSGAHCLQSKSELVHYVAFMFDYAGIGLYGLGSVILHIEYSARPEFKNLLENFILVSGQLAAVFVCFCCCLSKAIYKRPYPWIRKVWQMAPVATIYIILILPVVDRLISCFLYSTISCPASTGMHLQQMFWFAVSGFFFASQLPQSLMPEGRCDHFFHSHQIFHIAILICTSKQMDAVLMDFEENNIEIRSRLAPSFFSAFGPIICVVFCEFICILVFALITKYKLLEQYELKKSK